MRCFYQKLKKVLCIFFLAILVIHCGGGGIDGSGAPVDGNASASAGPISGFGSVIVNGVRYDTANANISISGINANESELRVGHYVTVIGEINSDNETGTANEIRFQPRTVGPVSSISIETNQITVLGQTVETTNSTIFDESFQSGNIEGINIGQTVRVSGLLNSNQTITATRIDLFENDQGEIFGSISAVNFDTNELEINSFVIDFSQAEIIGELVVGVNAFVSGTLVDDRLIANEINTTLFSIGDLGQVSTVLIAGSVSEIVDTNQFEINDFPVQTSTDTIFIGGESADITENTFLEVSGTVDDDGILLAQTVEIQPDNLTTLFGFAESIEIQSGPIPTATLVLSGQIVTTTDTTIFEDSSALNEREFNASSLQNGDPIVVVGNMENDTLVATYLERQDADTTFENEMLEIIGLADNISATGFDLFSFSVIFNDETVFRLNGETVLYEDLILPLEENPVFIEGILEGDIITATSIEIETSGIPLAAFSSPSNSFFF